MENEERTQLDAQHQKELNSLKEDVARLTSLLEQALRSKSEGTSSQPVFTAQIPPTPPTFFNLPNMRASGSSHEPQYATHFPAQPIYPMRIPHTDELTLEGSSRDKMIGAEGLEKWAALEERVRAVEGNHLYDPVKAAEMCLVPNVVIPKKFRVPEFIKYTGTQCPITHLKSYCNKMAEVVQDEKLLIHFFQDSLSDVALTWYMRLDNTKVKGWKDLVDAFIRQYKFDMDIAPDRSSLHSLEKGHKESIREPLMTIPPTSNVNFTSPYLKNQTNTQNIPYHQKNTFHPRRNFLAN
ncbi:hypothetical protein Peur_074603 [Populus x canadensis]